jgi:hypothetical protein
LENQFANREIIFDHQNLVAHNHSYGRPRRRPQLQIPIWIDSATPSKR